MDLTPEQRRTLDSLCAWLEIRSAAGHSFPENVEELWESFEHSALFRRLLAGAGALPEPPPLSFGQPWYELGEQGFAMCEVRRESDQLLINATRWAIVDDSKEGEFLVQRAHDPGTYLVWKVHPLSTEQDNSLSWMIERVRSAAA
jgi:hypothetical protein